MTYSDKLEMLKLVLTPPDFVSVHEDSAFVADYLDTEKLACRLKAFAGNKPSKEFLSRVPFNLLINWFIASDRSIPRKDVEAAAGRALFDAMSSGEMEGVKDLVEAFQLKRKEPRDVPSRRRKAASYFVKITDGDPFDYDVHADKDHHARIMGVFFTLCDELQDLPTREDLRNGVLSTMTRGWRKPEYWEDAHNKRVIELGLGGLPI